MPLTLAAARSALFKYGSNVDFAVATAAEKLAVDAIINQVQERFIQSGKPRLSLARARLVVYDSQITLPHSLETVIKALPVYLNAENEEESVSASNYSIYNQWYDISSDAVGNVDGACIPGLVDLGEQWPTFRTPDFTFTIRAVAEQTESSKTILFRGLNATSDPIYSAGGVEGVSLSITTTTATTQSFSRLDSWVKSVPTTSIVRLYAVPTTGDAILIAIIYPNEVVSGYRRYAVPNLEDDSIVQCLCKRAYVPAVSDNDIVIPSNLGALKLAMMALQYEDKNDWDRSDQYWQRAFALLEQDRQEYDGDSALPTLNFAGDFGAGSIVNVM